jgi:Spy/CpxP family protein refolding chaperone
MKPLSAVALFALSLGLALPAQARADDPSGPPVPPPTPPAAPTNPSGEPGGPPQGHHHHRPAYVLGELTEKLSLTPDQEKQVGAAIDSGASQAKQVRADETLSKDDRRARMVSIMKATRDQIRAALTPDQQKLFDALPAPGARPRPPSGN